MWPEPSTTLVQGGTCELHFSLAGRTGSLSALPGFSKPLSLLQFPLPHFTYLVYLDCKLFEAVTTSFYGFLQHWTPQIPVLSWPLKAAITYIIFFIYSLPISLASYYAGLFVWLRYSRSLKWSLHLPLQSKHLWEGLVESVESQHRALEARLFRTGSDIGCRLSQLLVN